MQARVKGAWRSLAQAARSLMRAAGNQTHPESVPSWKTSRVASLNKEARKRQWRRTAPPQTPWPLRIMLDLTCPVRAKQKECKRKAHIKGRVRSRYGHTAALRWSFRTRTLLWSIMAGESVSSWTYHTFTSLCTVHTEHYTNTVHYYQVAKGSSQTLHWISQLSKKFYSGMSAAFFT